MISERSSNDRCMKSDPAIAYTAGNSTMLALVVESEDGRINAEMATALDRAVAFATDEAMSYPSREVNAKTRRYVWLDVANILADAVGKLRGIERGE